MAEMGHSGWRPCTAPHGHVPMRPDQANAGSTGHAMLAPHISKQMFQGANDI